MYIIYFNFACSSTCYAVNLSTQIDSVFLTEFDGYSLFVCKNLPGFILVLCLSMESCMSWYRNGYFQLAIAARKR